MTQLSPIQYINLFFLAICSLSLVLRFYLAIKRPDDLAKLWAKKIPFYFDAILLISTTSMMWMSGFFPLVGTTLQLAYALGYVFAYMLLSYLTLYYSKNIVFKSLLFLGALGYLIMASNVIKIVQL